MELFKGLRSSAAILFSKSLQNFSIQSHSQSGQGQQARCRVLSALFMTMHLCHSAGVVVAAHARLGSLLQEGLAQQVAAEVSSMMTAEDGVEQQ